MSNAYLTRMPIGIAGHVTRIDQSTLESQLYNSAKPFTRFGVFAKFVSGKIEPIESGDAATVVVGVLARSYPSSSTSNALGDDEPDVDQTATLLRRGYINVKCSVGTPAANGIVYVRVTADTGKLVGDIEAVADGAENVVVVGAKFRGPADANGITEIEYNL